MLCLVGFYFSVRQVSIDARSIMLYLHQTLWPALAMAGVVYVFSFKLSFLITIPIGAGLYLALLYKTKVLTKDILLLVVEKIRLKPKSRTV
jgi:hypothetical protein